MALNYTFPVGYKTYSDFALDIFGKVLDLLRDDNEVLNYQFKAVELVGTDYVPDESGLPTIRLVPDRDSIDQNETNTRDHDVRFTLFVFDRKPNKGESSYREHVRIAGRVYDLLMINRDLDGLTQDMFVEQVSTRFGFADEAGGGMNFISVIRVNAFVTKEE